MAEALRLLMTQRLQVTPSDEPVVNDLARDLLNFLAKALFDVIDPYDSPELIEEVDLLDRTVVDQLIDLIKTIKTDPLIKPLLRGGRILDINVMTDDGLVQIQMESLNGKSRPVPTIKAGFF